MVDEKQPLNALIINAGEGRQDAVALGSDMNRRAIEEVARVGS